MNGASTTTKILLFEYITGGGLACDGDVVSTELHTLKHEGEQMLQAAALGLLALGDVELVVMRDFKLPPPGFLCQVIWLNSDSSWREIFLDAIRKVDLCWPIAPECLGLLSWICHQTEKISSCVLVLPNSKIVDITSSKLETYSAMHLAGIPHVPTWGLHESNFPYAFDTVIKPDLGAGGVGISLAAAGTFPDVSVFEGNAEGSLVVQPFVHGVSGSFSLLYEKDSTLPHILAINRLQNGSGNESFTTKLYQINGLKNLLSDDLRALTAIKKVWPELSGYIGIDFIIPQKVNSRAYSSSPMMLEVNPRITFPFVALQESLGTNPCDLVLQTLKGRRVCCSTIADLSANVVEVTCGLDPGSLHKELSPTRKG